MFRRIGRNIRQTIGTDLHPKNMDKENGLCLRNHGNLSSASRENTGSLISRISLDLVLEPSP
jgi:hypothetical protein